MAAARADRARALVAARLGADPARGRHGDHRRAALGPLYARAAGESTLRDRLTQAAVTDSGFSLQRHRRRLAAGRRGRPGGRPARAAGSLFGYPTRIAALAAQVSVTPVTAGRAGSCPPWCGGTAFCDHLVVVTGRCPTAAGEAMASSRTARRRLRLEARAARCARTGLSSTSPGGPRAAPRSRSTLRVVGMYRPKDNADPYWFAHPYFDARLGQGDKPDYVDAVFVAPSTFATLSRPTTGAARPGLPARPVAGIRLADEPRLRADMSTLQHQLRGRRTPTQLQTGLPAAARRRRPRARPAARVDHPGRRAAGAAGVARAVPGRRRRGRGARQRGRAGQAARLQRPVDGGVRARPAGGGPGAGDPRSACWWPGSPSR